MVPQLSRCSVTIDFEAERVLPVQFFNLFRRAFRKLVEHCAREMPHVFPNLLRRQGSAAQIQVGSLKHSTDGRRIVLVQPLDESDKTVLPSAIVAMAPTDLDQHPLQITEKNNRQRSSANCPGFLRLG
jgi:hypothetical protein